LPDGLLGGIVAARDAGEDGDARSGLMMGARGAREKTLRL
jgi:hypothetical protein